MVTDRYWLSTVAYGMLDEPMARMIALHHEILGENFLRPDRTFLLDLDPAIALSRIRASRTALTHFEKLEQLAKIRANYHAIIRANTDPVSVIDAAQAPHVVVEMISGELKPLLQ